MRKRFAEWCLERLRDDPTRFRVLLGDISVGLFIKAGTNDLHPGVLNLGILEQSMVAFAAGLSRGGITPIVHSISPFILERAYEQLKLDLSYNRTKVVLVSANGPFDYMKLGPTHHCSADIPLVDLIPRLSWAAPGRDLDVYSALDWALSIDQSSYVRLTKQASNSNVPAGVIINSGKPAQTLVIAVGEALRQFDERAPWSEGSRKDFLYIWRPDQIPLSKLSAYKTVELWEPFSKSVLFQNIFAAMSRGSALNSFTYPRSIESGVFSYVEFVR